MNDTNVYTLPASVQYVETHNTYYSYNTENLC